MIPGEYFLNPSDIDANAGRERVTILVQNTGDRPVQVGSHYHFFEVNSSLHFNRPATRGFRLNIPAGTSVRFEPGDEKPITLVAYGGSRYVAGFRGEVDGDL